MIWRERGFGMLFQFRVSFDYCLHNATHLDISIWQFPLLFNLLSHSPQIAFLFLFPRVLTLPTLPFFSPWLACHYASLHDLGGSAKSLHEYRSKFTWRELIQGCTHTHIIPFIPFLHKCFPFLCRGPSPCFSKGNGWVSIEWEGDCCYSSLSVCISCYDNWMSVDILV